MTITVWAARDSDGRLWLHFSEPDRDTLSGGSWKSKQCIDATGTAIDAKMERLRWEDAPIVCKLSDL